MTKQSWTAVVSAAIFLALAVLVGTWRVPFVAWAPGSTINVLGSGQNGKAAISVTGLPTYPTTGELLMTTVSVTRVDANLSLPEALADYWLPYRDVLPRDLVYPKGSSVSDVKQEEVAMMDTSKDNAVVAALRAAGQPVAEMPMVTAVVVSGPSNNKLQPGDLFETFDAAPVRTGDDIRKAIAKHAVGETVSMGVLRAGKQTAVQVKLAASNQDPKKPVLGIEIGTGYRYTPTVSYGIDPQIVGPSAGLMFALAIYDKITASDLVAGVTVAGTGTITPDGAVGPIGGIQEKIAAADSDHAKLFLVPAGNCQDIEGVKTSMTLVKVTSLRDAIAALQAVHTPGSGQEVPKC